MAGGGRSEWVSMHLEAGETERAARPLPGTPFHIALFGDFSARGARGGPARRGVAQRRPVPVDRDDIDEVLARLAPELHVRVDAAAPPVTVRITGLDDFHPDRLFESVPELAAVRGLRQRLADRRTADAAVRELLGPRGGAPAAAAPAPARASGAAVLEDILSETSGPAVRAAPPEEKDGLVRFIREALAGHVVADVDPRQGALLARLDREIGLRIGAILHDSQFQALEALWRGVQLLVRRLETGPDLKVFLVDVTRAELAADLLERDVAESGLYRLLVGDGAGTPEAPWSLLVGCYSFGPEPESVRLLGQLGGVARAVGAPWLAGAEPALAGWPSFADGAEPEAWSAPESEDWRELRGRSEAAWLGLAAPRFLLRAPYGTDNEPCELLPYEELGAAPAHEQFLWGNPALAAALLLGDSFSAEGWEMRPGAAVGRAEIQGLPLPLLHQVDGRVRAYPCAELPLSERSAALMLEAGVMPLAAQAERDSIRLLQLRSIARTPGPLPGRWTAPA